MTSPNKEALIGLLDKHRDLGISEQIDFKKFYIYSIIAHSTAIEGSTVTEIEAQLLFDEGITSSKRTMVEQMMNLDLKDAYEYGIKWMQRHEPITVEWLISLAAKVMEHTGSEYNTIAGRFSAARGELRKLNVSAGLGGPSYMSYQKVPSRLSAFCDELNSRRSTVDTTDPCAVYDLSFWAHYELVTIHPWADGNGRTSRLLMNLLQMEYDLLPVKVLKEDKAEYIQALSDTREKEDISIFLNCMARLHIEHLRNEIEKYLKTTGEGYGDERDETTQKTTQKTVGDTTQKILEAMKADPSVSRNRLAEICGITPDGIKWQLKKLQNKGIIRRVGPDKGGHWEIIDKH